MEEAEVIHGGLILYLVRHSLMLKMPTKTPVSSVFVFKTSSVPPAYRAACIHSIRLLEYVGKTEAPTREMLSEKGEL